MTAHLTPMDPSQIELERLRASLSPPDFPQETAAFNGEPPIRHDTDILNRWEQTVVDSFHLAMGNEIAPALRLDKT